ncbi:hypothetical protein AXG93_938s1040 [Marchantia polymorpha subsp. ruderalis]|uniref:Uncharacterized protein n=1 Tax=Marchantia polymorpha subsp. ruderalis TaxID=1480154 RepID=A0A176VRJ9_MARPO|nr:hypothetical protein AXG93_938s1040 [Marchantia polymorpha subsp. ruderalis]
MKGGGEHRRGRSMGSTTPGPDNKDEDLALFHEMKRREKHNFLHPSPDDLDVSLSSKFGGMGAPAKKSGTDLLTSDVDKNDYDWLLTPPGTPLFPSLDQEAAALAVISPQAPLLNGSSTANSSKLSHSPADPSPKSSRGNPSPRRAGSTTPNGTMSRSRSTPHNSTPVVATVSRPSTPNSSLTRPSTPTAKSTSTPSVRASTPNLKLSISASKSSSSTASTPTATRPSTPNARSSTPPVRPSTPGARSSTPTSKPSTPTMRRSLSGGRIASPATTRGGPSPKRTTSSRGNSPSAKRVTPIITTVAGMCSEAPPNLRTTVPERTSSTPKSSSNGSRALSDSGHASDAMDASGRSRRRPRSPSVSRSFSSSSSQDQRTSSQTSRGSVISSYDDGIEVSRPTNQSSRNSAAGKWHAAGHEDLLSGKANTNVQSKRVTRSLVVSSSSSVSGGTPSKKSLEPNKWQGEAYQHSPSSYRHLMASSPGSPFYGTRANSLIVRPASAMNSSVTTSSNASSEHGTTVAPDTEGSERDDDDLLSWDSYGRRLSPSPRGRQADILMLDKDEDKLVAWQDYDRLNSNDLVASYKPGMQSTLDTEVTSFYESDGIASLEMLEQLGLMGEVYNTKKIIPGERVLERRASNIEDGKVELRRSGERPLQRRASNIEDSRIPDVQRSDDGNGYTRAGYDKLGHEGHSGSGQLGSKLKRQELLDALNESRKYDADVHMATGERVLSSQKSKVSNADINAACLFVRDFRVGLAPPQGEEIASAISYSSSAPEEEATNTSWVGDGVGSIMSRKDFGNVRQTHDFSQQKLKVSGGTTSFTQMESKLPRRPQSRGKVGNSEPVLSHMQEASSKADVLRLQADENDNANNSALLSLVDVMERIKHESSQPKYLDLENQGSKTIRPTVAVLDGKLYVDSLRRPSHSQASDIRRGLSYEEIHAMDEVDTPELHDIEDDSIMYDGGKGELELLESLHRSALRKEEVRAMEEEVGYESPKRRFVMAVEADVSSMEAGDLHESPKRRCVEVKGSENVASGDAIVLHGSPSFSHEEPEFDVTNMNLDDFLLSGKENQIEVEASDEPEPVTPLKSGFQASVQFDGISPTVKIERHLTSEKDAQDVVERDGEETNPPSPTGVCSSLQEEDLIAISPVILQTPVKEDQLDVSNSGMVVEEEPPSRGKGLVLSEVEEAHTVIVDAPAPSDVGHQEINDFLQIEDILPEQVNHKQCSEPNIVTTDVSHCSEQEKHLEVPDLVKNQRVLTEDADGVSVNQEVDHTSASILGGAGGGYLTVEDVEKEEAQTLDSSTVHGLDDEISSSVLVELSNEGSAMHQPLPITAPMIASSEDEEVLSRMLVGVSSKESEMDQPILPTSQTIAGRDEEGSSSMSVEAGHLGTGMDQSIPLNFHIVVGKEDEQGLENVSVGTSFQSSVMDNPVLPEPQAVVGSFRKEDVSTETFDSGKVDDSQIVKDLDVVSSKEVKEDLFMASPEDEGSCAEAVSEGFSASDDILGKIFVKAALEECQLQLKDTALDSVPDPPYVDELSLHSGDEMEDKQERQATPYYGCESESKVVEEARPEGSIFSEERSRILENEMMESLEDDETSSVKSLGPSEVLHEPTADTLMSKPYVPLPHDVEDFGARSEELNQGSGPHHPGDASSLDTSEAASSKNLEFSQEVIGEDSNVCEVKESVAFPQSVTLSEEFSSNVSESSLKHHVVEESYSLEYLDTKSVETSDYFEAISEEKMDSEEVSSAHFVESKEVVLGCPIVRSTDERTGMSEGVTRPRSRLPTPLSEMRSASSLCAALEEQLAGLIQKIDSAIEESSKPFISGQQDVMVGKDKLSARTSELLREQEQDESPGPVRSNEEEDLLDMLWAEDDDSAYPEGSGEDDLSQLQESKPSGKDANTNQVNGEIRLSRSSENGLTLYSNGHPNEVSLDKAKTSTPVFAEEDVEFVDSPKSSLEVLQIHNNVNEGDPTSPRTLLAGALVHATTTPNSDEQDVSAADHNVVLEQPECVESLEVHKGPVSEGLDEDVLQDSAPDKEMSSESLVSSLVVEDERNISVPDIRGPDETASSPALYVDISETVSRDGVLSPVASLSPHQLAVVDGQVEEEKSLRLEDDISTDVQSVGECHSVGLRSHAVEDVEGSAGQRSADEEHLEKESFQDPHVGPTVGAVVLDDVVLADCPCAEVEPTGNQLSRTSPGSEHSDEDDPGRENKFSVDGVQSSTSNLSTEKKKLIEPYNVAGGNEGSTEGVLGADEETLPGEMPAVPSEGASAEQHDVNEAPKYPKVPSADQDPLAEMPESPQERFTADALPLQAELNSEVNGQTSEVLEADRAQGASSCDYPVGSSVIISDREPSIQSSTVETVLAGEYEEKLQDGKVAVAEKESTYVHAVPDSDSREPDAYIVLEDSVTDTRSANLEGDDGLTLGLRVVSSEDASQTPCDDSIKEDCGDRLPLNEESLSQVAPDSHPPLASHSLSEEQSEVESLKATEVGSEEPLYIREVHISATDIIPPKEELLLELQASDERDGEESSHSKRRNSVTFDNVPVPTDVENTAVTDEEDSYQECVSHNSSSLSTSVGSLAASSEQETYSAGTQGAAEEDQEETSQMLLSPPTNPTAEVSDSKSQSETLPSKSSEDQITSGESIVVESFGTDKPLDDSEVGPADNTFSARADGEEEMSSMVAKAPEILDHEFLPDAPIQSIAVVASGAEKLQTEASRAEDESGHEDRTDSGHIERSLISLGESPVCTESSHVSKSDEAESVNSSGIEDSSKSGEVQSAETSAGKPDVPHLPSVSESRIPALYKEEFISIEEEVWNEQRSSTPSDEKWNTAENLRQSEKLHVANGPKEVDRQQSLPSDDKACNMDPSSSHSENVEQVGNLGNLSEAQKDSEGHALSRSPTGGRFDVTIPSAQSGVPVIEIIPSERVTGDEKVESKLNNEGGTPFDAGLADAAVVGEKMNGVGSQLAKKLPISKAKSVRTMSLNSGSQNEPAVEERLSPDEAVQTQRPTGYTSVTVVSPESLQWEPSTTGLPAHGTRDTVDSANVGGELGKWNGEGVNSSPASVRRALAFMGQQVSSFTPVDTCLQSPPTQLFERDMKSSEKDGGVPETKVVVEDVKIPVHLSPPKFMLSPVKEVNSMDSPAHTIVEVSAKKDVAPIKSSKAKCSCTIM